MFWFKYLHSLLSTLNADDSPNEIAAGVMLGALLGLLPKANGLALLVWFVVFIFRVHFGMATAAVLIFSLLGSLTDPIAERMGFWLLTGVPALKPFWTTLFNAPMVPFTSFNNTLVTGNLALGTLLAVPIFFGARSFVISYRARLREKIMRWKIMQFLRGSKLYDLYSRWTSP